MARKVTTTELRSRIDGLALAFFAVMAGVLDAIEEIHPGGEDVSAEIQMTALDLLLSLDEAKQGVFTEETIERAFAAVAAVFARRGLGEGDNDNVPG